MGRRLVVSTMNPWTFDVDIAALIAIGGVAATFFWRMLTRIEKKIDCVSEEMVKKHECDARYEFRENQFRNHYHLPNDGVAVFKGGVFHEVK